MQHAAAVRTLPRAIDLAALISAATCARVAPLVAPTRVRCLEVAGNQTRIWLPNCRGKLLTMDGRLANGLRRSPDQTCSAASRKRRQRPCAPPRVDNAESQSPGLKQMCSVPIVMISCTRNPSALCAPGPPGALCLPPNCAIAKTARRHSRDRRACSSVHRAKMTRTEPNSQANRPATARTVGGKPLCPNGEAHEACEQQ